MSLQYVCFLLVLFAFDANGQSGGTQIEADSTVALPEIQINATRYGFGPADIPVRISTLEKDALEATAARNLSEVLERASGVHLRRYGTGLSTVSIRGASSSQSLVLMDGMPLTDPQLGQVDLSLVPSLVLESVSVMHGSGSSLFGANGVGGVINLKSLSYAQEPVFGHFLGSVGPFGERAMEGVIGGGGKHIKGIIAGQYGEEKGDFPYTHPSLFPETTVRRVGADRTHWSLLGKIDRLSERSKTALGFWLTRFERGLPGPTAFPPRDERQWDDFTRLSLQHFMVLPKGSLMVRGSSQFSSLRYSNPFLQIDDTGRTSSLLGEARYNISWNALAHARFGLDTALREATHPSLSSEAREWQGSLYAQGELNFKILRLFPSIRLDRFTSPGTVPTDAISPTLGINITPPFMPSLHVKGQVGNGFRSPTFNDRFWQPGGNPSLRPETSFGYEAGVFWSPVFENVVSLLNLEVTAYQQRIEDQIAWIPTENGYWAPFNINRVVAKGIESSVRIHIKKSDRSSLSTEVLYNITQSRNRSDPEAESYNKQLRYTPEHSLKIITGLSQSVSKARVGVNVFIRRTGSQFLTTDGQSALPAFWTGDVRLITEWNSNDVGLSLNLLLENIFDHKYEVIKGYPVPPRLLRVQMGIRFPGF